MPWLPIVAMDIPPAHINPINIPQERLWPLLRVARGVDRPGDWSVLERWAAENAGAFQLVVELLLRADQELEGQGTPRSFWERALRRDPSVMGERRRR